MISRSWHLPAIIIAAALSVATPASAVVSPPAAELTAPSASSDPMETAPSPTIPADGKAEAELPTQPVPVPSAIEPGPESSVEPSPAVPLPTATSSAPEETPAEPAEHDLESLIGILGASMGQGLERIEDTQDPQVPGDRETAERIDAEQTLIQEDLADPSLATPTDTVPEATPAAGSAAPASFSMLSQREQPVTLAATVTPTGVQGMDVSSHQPSVNWKTEWNKGARYAYVKASEATSYKNPLFSSQTKGASGAGMLRGAYHFAIPNVSSGAAQANYFVNNGGGWSADGNTLPPLLDVEYNPYPELGNICYDMSPAKMVQWIKDFSTTVASRTGRLPMIYTTTDWWKTCTGNSPAFASQPLHIAAYGTSSAGALPNGWRNYTLWQYSSTGPFQGDSNVYNGSLQQLNDFARGKNPVRTATLHYRGASSLAYGHTSDSFVACDWDGDGVSTPAAYRDGTWYIRNNLTGTAPVTEIRYGESGDLPICGDWDGDGRDTVGVYRNGMAYLRNTNTTGKADGTFAYGQSYDVPLVGDWNGDGYDTLGVVRADGVASRFYLTDSNIRPSVTQNFRYGNAGDTPVSGDWDADGYSTVGVQRGNVWYLTDNRDRPAASSVFAYGNLADRPLTGVWDQGAGTSVGVVR